MKKIYLVFLAVFMNVAFYACTPETIAKDINGTVCCDEEGTIPPPPPPQDPGANEQ